MAKTEVIMVRVSPEEKTSIEKEAEESGLSVSAFIRLLVKQWSDGIRFERKQEQEKEEKK